MCIIVITILLFIPIGRQIYITPLGFDESFNLQIPVSLVKTGQYKSLYIPEKAYDARISAGYPLHIGQAVFFKLFGIQRTVVRMYMMVLFLLLVITGYLYLKIPLSCLFFPILFFISVNFASTTSYYLGENVALLCIILALYFSANKKQALSAFIFSLAVHSKIHAISLLPLFLLVSKERAKYMINFFMFFLMGFVLLFWSTYLLGFRQVSPILYVKQYYWDLKTFLRLNSGIDDYNKLLPLPNLIHNLKSMFIYGLNISILIPTFFLLKKYKIWIVVPLGMILYALIFKGVKNAEFLYIALFIFFLKNSSVSLRKVALILFLVYNSLNIIPRLNLDLQHQKSLEAIRNQEEVAKKVRSLKGNVYTSGWWQEPEISFLSDVPFRDRMQYKGNQSGYLLFSSMQRRSYWPTVDMNRICKEIIFCKYNYGICRLYRTFPIDTNIYPKMSINHKNCPVMP